MVGRNFRSFIKAADETADLLFLNDVLRFLLA